MCLPSQGRGPRRAAMAPTRRSTRSTRRSTRSGTTTRRGRPRVPNSLGSLGCGSGLSWEGRSWAPRGEEGAEGQILGTKTWEEEVGGWAGPVSMCPPNRDSPQPGLTSVPNSSLFPYSVPTFTVVPEGTHSPSPLLGGDEEEPSEGVPIEQYRAWLGEQRGSWGAQRGGAVGRAGEALGGNGGGPQSEGCMGRGCSEPLL